MAFWQRRSRWTDVDYMTLVPERACPWEEAPADPAAPDRVVVLRPRYTDPIGRRLIQPRLGAAKRYLRIPLEARGSLLWREMDGERSVADLVRLFARAFPDDADDAPRRVALYLAAMCDHKLIRYLNEPT